MKPAVKLNPLWLLSPRGCSDDRSWWWGSRWETSRAPSSRGTPAGHLHLVVRKAHWRRKGPTRETPPPPPSCALSCLGWWSVSFYLLFPVFLRLDSKNCPSSPEGSRVPILAQPKSYTPSRLMKQVSWVHLLLSDLPSSFQSMFSILYSQRGTNGRWNAPWGR